MKVVNKLKKKHQRDVWIDSDGIVWFWDTDSDDWLTLEPEVGGHYVGATEDCEGWPSAPFTRVVKGVR